MITTLRNIKKDVIMTILAIGLLFAIVKACTYKRDNDMLRKNAKSQEKVIDGAIKNYERKEDTAGREHLIFKEGENPQTAIDRNVAPFVKQLDSVRKIVGTSIIKRNEDIINYTKIEARIEAKRLKSLRLTDSLNRTYYSYQDKTFDLSFYPELDSLANVFNASANVSPNILNYSKRKWLLGKKTAYTDIWFDDERIKINGVKRYTVEQKEAAFGLRVRASGLYDFKDNTAMVGPEVSFDFKRSQVRAKYYYDYTTNKWYPILGYSFDLIRF